MEANKEINIIPEREKTFTSKEEKKVLQTLYGMMKARGYCNPPRVKNKTHIFSADSLPTIEIRIFRESKIGIAHIKNFVHPNCSNYIFVSSVGITPKARKTCKNYQLHDVFIEPFCMAELMFTVIDHIYCPRHRLCSPQETAEVLKNLGVAPEEKYDKMPSILAKDPVMRYYGIREGNLIEITRDSITMPGYPEITYRIVTGSNL